MRYIAAIDYAHLDNGMFLTALARSISSQKNVQPVIVHGDSEYTERIMQTGVMRDDAKIRSIKGLNHRLINLFADEGVSAVGINGYQRKLITQKNNQLSIDDAFFDRLPAGPTLLISTLIWDEETESPQPIPLSKMISFLREKLKAEAVFAFTAADRDEIIINTKPEQLEWNNLPEGFADKHLPEELRDFNHFLQLTTAREFANVPDEKKSIAIR